ncbi:ras suppressor protein 1-like [Pollicipes pollicipes]|uniref:ras suppressor protein 1-like n=1 Tax=Pollicipes pollicipes TaxID=41117 RepID=UPI001885419E|nr:ras suppressor protein 1-like [Pollicipes pollicipes]
MIESLRALYLGDNDLEYLPPDVKMLKNLQILVLRENDLLDIPKEVGSLARLRELHIQGNRLTVLPPEIGLVDLSGSKCVLRMDDNPWVVPIADQLELGVNHVIDYIRSDTYRILYSRHISAGAQPAPPKADKSRKVSRLTFEK